MVSRRAVGFQKQYMFIGRTIAHAIGVSKGLGRVGGLAR